MLTVYDEADWHREGAYPSDLPPACAAIPAGMFFAWAIHRGRLAPFGVW